MSACVCRDANRPAGPAHRAAPKLCHDTPPLATFVGIFLPGDCLILGTGVYSITIGSLARPGHLGSRARRKTSQAGRGYPHWRDGPKAVLQVGTRRHLDPNLEAGLSARVGVSSPVRYGQPSESGSGCPADSDMASEGEDRV